MPILSRWERLKYRYEYRVIRIRSTASIARGGLISKRYLGGEKTLESSNPRAPREPTDTNSDAALNWPRQQGHWLLMGYMY